MVWNYDRLSLDGFRPEPEVVHTLTGIALEVDGEEWDHALLADAQARLVALDDFAIVQLEVRFANVETLAGGRIEVTGVGLRNLNLDGTYLTPLEGSGSEGYTAYALPEALPAGDHHLVWSYAWNPPTDSEGQPAADGVVLLQPRLVGPFVGAPDALRPVPQVVDLRALDDAGLVADGIGVELRKEIDIMSGVASLVVEGPSDGTVQLTVNGKPLPAGAVVPHRFPLHEECVGSVTLGVRLHGVDRNISAIRKV